MFDDELVPSSPVVAIVGNFGSGKTETTVNYAIYLAKIGQQVTIVDLDIVNPYFRSREVKEQLEQYGITVVIPEGEHRYADLPIIIPQVKQSILQPSGIVLLDVGGDDLGARVLGSFQDTFEKQKPMLMQVVNTSRPFTETIEGCIKMQSELEQASKQKIVGYIANTHLMQFTKPQTILDGIETISTLSKQTSIPVSFVVVEKSMLKPGLKNKIDLPILPMQRFMLNPWQISGHRPLGVPPKINYSV